MFVSSDSGGGHTMSETHTCEYCSRFMPDDHFPIFGECLITERFDGAKNICNLDPEKWEKLAC
jgi:hypothetical protein